MPTSTASVCVFCGARDGINPAYRAAALEFGAMLANNGWRLVYGAGDIGIMGAVASSTLAADGDSLGVVPSHLLGVEKARADLARLVVTETMHERKKVMFTNSDAIVLLPGGAGSLDEFFEVLTWRQLGLHQKPILLFDVEGYWQPLAALIEHVIAQGFAETDIRQYFSLHANLDALEAALDGHLSPVQA